MNISYCKSIFWVILLNLSKNCQPLSAYLKSAKIFNMFKITNIIILIYIDENSLFLKLSSATVCQNEWSSNVFKMELLI